MLARSGSILSLSSYGPMMLARSVSILSSYEPMMLAHSVQHSAFVFQMARSS